MEVLDSLLYGFRIATTPVNLLYCFIGVFFGTLVGVLPGLGTVTGVAILIALTFGMNPTTAMIMLAGIYYGAQYGGSTTAILLDLPGESTSVMTCLASSADWSWASSSASSPAPAPRPPPSLAAPEAANNAAAGAMVPLLTLGIPGSGTTAVMLGALMLYGT